ncbi:MAG: universal stress protein [Cyanobacteriota bacterium]|jgi:nucleotide-binding universal stress UspA family protein|nr:universal stress protein [Cyanobacteriota bacterium]
MLYQHLLVPSDGTPLSLRALDQALALAKALGSQVTLLHVQPPLPVPLVGMGDMLDPATVESLSQTAEKESARILQEGEAAGQAAGVALRTEVVKQDLPYRAIVETAKRQGCDLIVMASHGRKGLSGLLIGSETQRVLLHAPIPVLVVR